MNILSIGNSFSQDAQRYLHRIARADKVELNTFNLYIGGCPLSLHYQNILSEERRYTLEMNGSSTGFYVSLKEGLLNREWDVVTPVKQQDPWGTCGSAAICPDCGYVLADYTGDNESLKRQREEIMDIMMALFDQETLMKRDFWIFWRNSN